MTVITAPEPINNTLTSLDTPAIFIAGGITGCTDWQSTLIPLINSDRVTLYNPRRPDDATWQWTSEGSTTQIHWEQDAIDISDAVSFWFDWNASAQIPPLQPIAMFELGRMIEQIDTKLFIGSHPNYPRHFDVVTQLARLRPDITIVGSIDDLAAQINNWVNGEP